MEPEQLDRLLAEYATGGLSEEEKKALFTAALSDQDLFDRLMEEDAVRELIEMPGARNRLIDSLQEEPVSALQMASVEHAVLRMPSAPAQAAPASPKLQPPRQPVWLAWAAGIGVVFVSGAITYMMFERADSADVAQVRSEAPKDVKPFVAPPSAASPQKPNPVIVEEPPKIMAENRGPAKVPAPAPVVLPSAPPAPVAEAISVKEEKAVDKTVAAAQTEAYRAQSDTRDRQQQAPASQPPPPPREAARMPMLARRSDAPAGGAAASGMVAPAAKAKDAASPPSVWRRAADGVWVRVPDGNAVSRNETVAIRYAPLAAATVALYDQRGREVTSKNGRVGEELELILPASSLAGASGNSLTLTISEETRPAGVVGGVASSNMTAPPRLQITLKLR